jgi:hypothetical protein
LSRESFRRDLNRELDAISGSPSPALSSRVRAALNQPVSARPAPLWVAGLAAALIAAIVIGLLVVANFNRNQTGVAPAGQPSPSASPSGNPTATPDSSLPPFVCISSGVGSSPAPQVAFIAVVRAGTHTGYDRLTVEFQNAAAGTVELRTQTSANFTQSPSGQPITLKGNAGILVTIRGADEHTAFTGATDIKPGYPVLLEARQLQDFEGVVQWGLGLSKSACYRAFILTNPARLVIDIQTD